MSLGPSRARRRCTQRTAHRRRGQPPPYPSPPPSPPAKSRMPRRRPSRDQAKVQLLTTMVALKDEILRASDEKVRALKWAALNDFDKDAGSLEALLSQLEERVSGWRGSAEGTSIVAPLVLKRRGGRRGAVLRGDRRRVRLRGQSRRRAARVPTRLPRTVARNFGERLHEAFWGVRRAAGVPAVVEPAAAAAPTSSRRPWRRRGMRTPRRRRPPPPRRRSRRRS